MTESSTNDKTKSTPTTPRSKALSTEAEPPPEAALELASDLSALFPGYIRKLRGFADVAEAIESARKQAKLPSLNLTDYRFVLKLPGGIPFAFPVQVIYMPGTAKEKDLGTFRVGR
jgi:hypothetical protein